MIVLEISPVVIFQHLYNIEILVRAIPIIDTP